MTEIEKIKHELTALKDAYTKQTKTLNDLLLNLDFDNMPQVKKSILRYVNDANQSIASIVRAVDENSASINQTVQRISQTEQKLTETEEKITDVANDVKDVLDDIKEVSDSVTKVTETTADISQKVTDSEAKIALIVKTKTTADGKEVSYVDGGIIIEAINGDESQVTISGDKINIEGVTKFVTKDDLANGDSGTVINGSLIQTNTIEVNQIKKTTTTTDDLGSIDGITFDSDIKIIKERPNIICYDQIKDASEGLLDTIRGYATIGYTKIENTTIKPFQIASNPGSMYIFTVSGQLTQNSTDNDIRIGAGIRSYTDANYDGSIYLFGKALYFNGTQIA